MASNFPPTIRPTAGYYEAAYAAAGIEAQRKYPNEELCRFMGRHFFGVPRERRKSTRILEVGSGSGANLWMIADEGFDAYGIELSASGNTLCGQVLASKNLHATLVEGSMTETGFPAEFFDAVIDVFSSYCLAERDYTLFLAECHRIIKAGGWLFSYTPSKASDAFTNHLPSRKLDASTLDGIRRPTSPFFNNLYPFRFEDERAVAQKLSESGLELRYLETVSRTYTGRTEYFEFLIFEAQRPAG